MCINARYVKNKGAETMVDRREQRRLDTRRRLLDAAEQVFSQQGYQDASVLDITEAADVSKRTFYLHFADKEAIIEALAMRRFEDLRARVESAETEVSPDETFREGFQRITQIIFEYASKNPEIMQIVFGRGGSFRLQAMTREFTVRAWEENMARKCSLCPTALVPPSALANAIAGVVYQLLSWWFQTPNRYTPAEMAAMCTAVLFDSIEVHFDHESHRAAAHGQAESVRG
jgi:AcrR family transcriptional regulator